MPASQRDLRGSCSWYLSVKVDQVEHVSRDSGTLSAIVEDELQRLDGFGEGIWSLEWVNSTVTRLMLKLCRKAYRQAWSADICWFVGGIGGWGKCGSKKAMETSTGHTSGIHGTMKSLDKICLYFVKIESRRAKETNTFKLEQDRDIGIHYPELQRAEGPDTKAEESAIGGRGSVDVDYVSKGQVLPTFRCVSLPMEIMCSPPNTAQIGVSIPSSPAFS
ncbi:hypothetical protein C8J56DRAFT_889524 [Mycena floridula]|nr:hypothetical protein C8J56DRAFT_889524 [Mycena floridula]